MRLTMRERDTQSRDAPESCGHEGERRKVTKRHGGMKASETPVEAPVFQIPSASTVQ